MLQQQVLTACARLDLLWSESAQPRLQELLCSGHAYKISTSCSLLHCTWPYRIPRYNDSSLFSDRNLPLSDYDSHTERGITECARISTNMCTRAQDYTSTSQRQHLSRTDRQLLLRTQKWINTFAICNFMCFLIKRRNLQIKLKYPVQAYRT